MGLCSFWKAQSVPLRRCYIGHCVYGMREALSVESLVASLQHFRTTFTHCLSLSKYTTNSVYLCTDVLHHMAPYVPVSTDHFDQLPTVIYWSRTLQAVVHIVCCFWNQVLECSATSTEIALVLKRQFCCRLKTVLFRYGYTLLLTMRHVLWMCTKSSQFCRSCMKWC